MASWKELFFCERYAVIQSILGVVEEKVENECDIYKKILAEKYDPVVEARMSEAMNILAIIKGMHNTTMGIDERVTFGRKDAKF